MRDFRIVAVAYQKNTPINENIVRGAVDSLVSKMKSPEETVMVFRCQLDEEKTREKLDIVRATCEKQVENLGVVVFESLKYNPSNPQEYDYLFYEISTIAKEFDITFVILLQYEKSYYYLGLRDFQAEYGKDGGIEQDIELLISAEPLYPDKYVARVLKNRCGNIGNYLIDV